MDDVVNEEEETVPEDVAMKAPKDVIEVSTASGNVYHAPTADVDPGDVADLEALGWTKAPAPKGKHK